MKRMRLELIVTIALCLPLMMAGCGGKDSGGGSDENTSLTQGGGSGSTGGLSWSVPSKWKDAGDRPMRVATYAVPGGGDGVAGECAVFYFGSGQGGDVRSNIARWVGQFENPAEPVEATRDVNGMRVTTVTTTGAYLSPAGPMMESQGKLENYALLGAIVEGPQGFVFFKMTGPSATVTAARGDFEALLGSLK